MYTTLWLTASCLPIMDLHAFKLKDISWWQCIFFLFYIQNFNWIFFFSGLKYAGSRNANAQDLLYSYAIYFLNEVLSCLPHIFVPHCLVVRLCDILVFCRLSLFLVQLEVYIQEDYWSLWTGVRWKYVFTLLSFPWLWWDKAVT